MNPETQPEFGAQLPEEEIESTDEGKFSEEIIGHIAFYAQKMDDAAKGQDIQEMKVSTEQTVKYISLAAKHAQDHQTIVALKGLLGQAEGVANYHPDISLSTACQHAKKALGDREMKLAA